MLRFACHVKRPSSFRVWTFYLIWGEIHGWPWGSETFDLRFALKKLGPTYAVFGHYGPLPVPPRFLS